MTDKPTHTDVLLGRGVATNRHRGNENFRAIVSEHVDIYVTRTKKQKMMIARSIVKKVQTELEPRGRFLEKNAKTGLWYEVKDKRALEKTAKALRDGAALEKTAQALRDGAAPLRKKLPEDMNDSAFLEQLFENDPAFMEEILGGESGARPTSAPLIKKVMPKPKQQKGPKTSLTTKSNVDIPASSGYASNNQPAHPKKHHSNQDMASGLDIPIEMYQLFNPSLFQSQGQRGNTNSINQSVQPQLEPISLQQLFQPPFVFSHDGQNPTMSQNQLLSSATMSLFNNASGQHVNNIIHRRLNTATGDSFCNSNDQQSSLTDIFNLALFNRPGQLPSVSVSAPPSLFSTQHNDTAMQQHRTSRYLTGTTTSINGSVNTMEPLSYVPPPQEVECHQVEPSLLEGAYPLRRRSVSASLAADATNAMDDEEFVREMGSDEHFFGLCNSDPIDDADFDGDAIFGRI